MTGKLFKKILMGLVAELPLSLITKLADGRLTATEIIDISRQVATVVARVLAEEFGDDDVLDEMTKAEKI